MPRVPQRNPTESKIKMKTRHHLNIFIASALYCLSTVLGAALNEVSLYSEISPANRTFSLEKVKALPIKSFEFVYDKVQGRRQIGVLGADAMMIVPESLEIIPKYPIPNKDRTQPPLILTNFPVVDKNVLFMHGLAALQELLDRYDNMMLNLKHIDELKESHLTTFEEIKSKLASMNTNWDKEEVELKEMESELLEKELALESAKMLEKRARIDEELENNKRLLDYEEQLARQRMAMQEQLTRDSITMSLTLEKELAEKREQTRLHNAELLESKRIAYNTELEQKKSSFAVELIKAEIEAKAAQERANEDLNIRKLQTQAKLDTQRIIDSVLIISQQLTTLVKEFLSRPKQIAAVAGAVLSVFAIYYLFRQLVSMLRTYIQARLGRPSLVRETSYSWSIFPVWLSWEYWFTEKLATRLQKLEDQFANVILSSEDRARVLQLSLSTRNTKATGAPYRHVLLHGPPGTGKTLIARQLAKSSGMDYAIMSGGDVGPLGEDAVDQLHSLFKWASRSNKGLLLFIDEAEAFLSSRRSTASGGDGGSSSMMDANIRHALNALLYQTGTQSKAFMLVLATNRPEDLDAAVLDRIDVSMLISLPLLAEREAMTELYMQEQVHQVALKSQRSWRAKLGLSRLNCSVEPECLAIETIRDIAVRCEGFSGREISKLCIAAQYAMLLAENHRLTKELLLTTVKSKIEDHRQTRQFATSSHKKPPTPSSSARASTHFSGYNNSSNGDNGRVNGSVTQQQHYPQKIVSNSNGHNRSGNVSSFPNIILENTVKNSKIDEVGHLEELIDQSEMDNKKNNSSSNLYTEKSVSNTIGAIDDVDNNEERENDKNEVTVNATKDTTPYKQKLRNNNNKLKTPAKTVPKTPETNSPAYGWQT